MPGPWTDAHCHLADPRLAADVADVVARSRAAGVTTWLQGGVGPDDWQRQLALRERLGADLRTSFGLHPWWVATASDADLDRALADLEEALPAADALGEIGLDAHPRWRKRAGAFARQERAMSAQLALAQRVPRPLVLHVVRAHEPVLAALERCAPLPRGGLVHAFTGTVRDARRYVDLGLLLSLGGALVSRPERVRELAEIPIDHVVVETDAPDQAPRAWQVAANEPAFLPRIAGALAPAWGISGADLLDRAHISMETLLSS